MSFSEYLLGAAELALIAAALCLGAYYVRAAILPSWSGAPARLCESILAITGLILVAELVGVVGLFRPGFIVAGSALLGLGAARWGARGESKSVAEAAGPPPAAPPVSKWMLAVAAGVSALVVAHWAIPTQQALDVGMYSQDTVWYHMSFAGHFAQESQVGPILITDPLKVVSWFYPQNSELLHGVGISAFGHDVASPLLNIGWLALCLLAAWCIGRPYGLGPLTLTAVALVLDTPMMVEQAGNAPSDTIALFFLLATVAILVNADAVRRETSDVGAESPGEGSAASERAPSGDSPETGSSARFAASPSPDASDSLAGLGTGPVVMAGLAAGLAVGTKITLLAAIGALTLALIYLAGAGQRLRLTAIWGAALAVPSAFWYLRNLFEAGNPLPWIQKGPLPGPEQLSLYPRKPHTVADYATDTGVWSDWFFPALDDRLGPLWIVLMLAAIGGLVALAVSGRTTILRVLAGIGLVAMVAYAFTPLSAAGAEGSPSGFGPNLRYFSPGFAVGLALVPLAIPLIGEGRRRLALGALVAALLAGTIVQATFDAPVFSQAEIEQIAAEGQSGFRSFAQESYDSDKLGGALLLAAVLVLVPLALFLPRGEGRRPLIVGVGCAALVAVTIGLGGPQLRDYVRDRYDTNLANPFEREAGFRASTQWKQVQQWGRSLTDTRIAVVGRAAAFGQYVFYGPDSSNQVRYVADELPMGGARPIDSCPAWRQELNDGAYDFVVITPRFGELAFSVPPEIAWTSKDPAAPPVIQTGSAAVFQLNGPLDLALCTPATAKVGGEA